MAFGRDPQTVPDVLFHNWITCINRAENTIHRPLGEGSDRRLAMLAATAHAQNHRGQFLDNELAQQFQTALRCIIQNNNNGVGPSPRKKRLRSFCMVVSTSKFNCGCSRRMARTHARRCGASSTMAICRTRPMGVFNTSLKTL